MTTSTDPNRAGWRPNPLSRAGVLLAGAVMVSALGGWAKRGETASDAGTVDLRAVAREIGGVSAQLHDARGEVKLMTRRLERANAVIKYSAEYQIPADLASAIYDIALSEGIDPAIGFRLVRVESRFKAGARSSANAIGYAQVQLPTARFYEPGIEEEQLFDRDVNLRLGFRFLNDLLERFDGDIHLALLAYNRGPARVRQILAQGGNPANGYSTAVLSGYEPRESPDLFE